jgi:predicted DsbA family dithiol-disulfide isomerase
MKVSIDVVSDVICPWCFLGKRRLDKALAMLDGIEVEVAWRPFMLDPTIPKEGLSRHAYMTAKFGAERLKTIHDPLIAAGKEDGVPYRFEAITRTPNTLDAHRVIRWAHQHGKQHELAERLFMAYWNEGKDVGEHHVLADVAAASGMDRAQVISDLASELDAGKVMGEIAMAGRMGVTGVPTFILGRKYGVVGAQSAGVIADAIRKLAADGMQAATPQQ